MNRKLIWTRGLSALIVCLLLPQGCSPVKCDDTKSAAVCLRILFLGNSFTSVNDLPATFAELANSGHHRVDVGMFAPGGWSLADHVKSQEMLDILQSSNWDYVVLQEQSQIPSMEQSREMGMYPAARTLIEDIRRTGAKSIFFQTWAHQNGWPENGMPDFESMQAQIDLGYRSIAGELGVPIAPVGEAWADARSQDPFLNLWQEDGIHPSEEGTYLAACVFYALIYKESAVGLSFRGNLSSDTAQSLQSIVSDTVLK